MAVAPAEESDAAVDAAGDEVDGLFEVIWFLIAPDVERLIHYELDRIARWPGYAARARQLARAARQLRAEWGFPV